MIIGSLNIDIVVLCSHRPQPGETVIGLNHQFFSGGKGGNQAVAASHMGAGVSMVGCIGNDYLGEIVTANLKKSGVSISAVRHVENKPTGAAFISIDKDGENSIIVSPGANVSLTGDTIIPFLSLIESSDILFLQCEVPVSATEKAISRAKEQGIVSLLNLAPCLPIPDESILWKSTIITVNEIEAAYYTGLDVRNQEDAEKAGRELVKRGAGIAIITLGDMGSVSISEEGVHRQKAVKVDVVDTTAAGDTYIGAFGVEWIRTKSIEAAMKFGSAAAALAVSKMGAQSSIPGEKAVRSLIEETFA